MKFRKTLTKAAAVLLSAALLGALGTAEYYSSRLPSVITKEAGGELRIAEYPEISCCGTPTTGKLPSEGTRATLSLFGAIPVKSVSVHEAEAPVLAAGGDPFGIKLLMDGVMVTELSPVRTADGKDICPAAESGIETGDIIRLADGEELTSNDQLQDIISGSKGRTIQLSVSRGNSVFSVKLTPVKSASTGAWRGGMWVRDSIAGIGTVTFINKSTGEFAGLGHPVCDSDTGELIPISSGEAVPVEITDTRPGEKGIPGELRGKFTGTESYGLLDRNTSHGVYGILSDEAAASLLSGRREYKMGYRQDIKTGKAFILATVKGTSPEKFSVEIEEIDYNSTDDSRNMVIHITDPRLIEATGGIVQGMSGSPVIQDDKLIGAVTHVFISDPTRGYAIFAENMLSGLSR